MADSQLKTVLEGDAAKLFQEFSKVITKAKELEGGYEKVERASKKAGERASESFGQKALGQLTSYVTGLASIGAAVGMVTKVLNEAKQAGEDFAQKQRAAAGSIGMLAQLAGGDKAKMGELTAATKQVFKASGAPTMGEAANVVFQLQSAGALKEAQFAGQLAAVAGPEGVSGMLGKAGKLRAAFGPQAGSFKQIMSMGAAAAAPVTEAGIGDILEASAKAAGSAKALGMSPEETFAAVSMVSQVYRPEEAGTAVSHLTGKLGQMGYGKRFAGKPLAEMLRSMPEAERKKLGITETRALQQLAPGALETRTAAVREGARTESIMEAIGLAEEATRTEREFQQATAGEEVGAEGVGKAWTRWQTRQKELKAMSREAGRSEAVLQARWLQREVIAYTAGPAVAEAVHTYPRVMDVPQKVAEASMPMFLEAGRILLDSAHAMRRAVTGRPVTVEE